MSKWRYQIVEHDEWDDRQFAIHEAFMEKDAEVPDSVTIDPVDFQGDTAADVINALEMALKDAKAYGSLPMTGFME